MRSAVVIGGVGMAPQIKAFSHSHIIVACPGRLVRLLANGSVNLNAIDTLVLDEADRMLDMGFMPDIKRVIARLPQKRQNLLFSATMPDDIRKLANRILVSPKTVQVANTSPVASVTHSFYATHTARKNEMLENLLARAEHESVLIFTRTKHKAKNLSRKLSNSGYNSTFLQGNMSQGQRQRALDGFRNGSSTSWLRRTSPPVASTATAYPTSSTLTCRTRLRRTPTALGGPAGQAGQETRSAW